MLSRAGIKRERRPWQSVAGNGRGSDREAAPGDHSPTLDFDGSCRRSAGGCGRADAVPLALRSEPHSYIDHKYCLSSRRRKIANAPNAASIAMMMNSPLPETAGTCAGFATQVPSVQVVFGTHSAVSVHDPPSGTRVAVGVALTVGVSVGVPVGVFVAAGGAHWPELRQEPFGTKVPGQSGKLPQIPPQPKPGALECGASTQTFESPASQSGPH